jgi:hypothetical protein
LQAATDRSDMSAQTKRAGVVAGIAAAGAVGLATLASTALAPTARADDFSDIVASIQGDFTAGDAEFASAFSDFSGGNAGLGLTELFEAVGDYTQAAPDNLLIGSLDALTGVPISGPNPEYLVDVSSLPAAITIAENLYSEIPSLFSEYSSYLADGNYAEVGYLTVDIPQALTFTPLEEILIGAVNSL